MPLTQSQLNEDILNIKIFHSRLGNDRSLALAYHTGNWWYVNFLTRKSMLIGLYICILERYNADGSDSVENVITNADVGAIIDDAYRELEQWNI